MILLNFTAFICVSSSLLALILREFNNLVELAWLFSLLWICRLCFPPWLCSLLLTILLISGLLSLSEQSIELLQILKWEIEVYGGPLVNLQLAPLALLLVHQELHIPLLQLLSVSLHDWLEFQIPQHIEVVLLIWQTSMQALRCRELTLFVLVPLSEYPYQLYLILSSEVV